MRLERTRAILLLMTGVWLAAGCGAARTTTLTQAGPDPTQTGDASALVAKGDGHWHSRGERLETEAALKAWAEATRIDPTEASIQLKLAYGYYFWANSHLKWDDDDDAMLAAFDKGVVAAEQAIRLTSPDFAKKIQQGDDWEQAITSVGKDGMPAMYWYATNLGKWAVLDGFVTILRLKDRVEAIMQHVLELDENFFHAAPHRYFGVYRTKIPFPGGDLEASGRHFARAVALAPNYLDTKVLYASEYATRTDDPELYRKLLQEVLDSPDDTLPELVPESRNAKRTAQQLLDDMEEKF